jgi:hypothetical protein
MACKQWVKTALVEIDVTEFANIYLSCNPRPAHFEGNMPETEPFPPYTNGPLNEEPLIPINIQDVALLQYPARREV